MSFSESEHFRSSALSSLIPHNGDYFNPEGFRRRQIVSPDFAAALELVAEDHGLTIEIAKEGEPSFLRGILRPSLLLKGEAEVTLEYRQSDNLPIGVNKINSAYQEAKNLLS